MGKAEVYTEVEKEQILAEILPGESAESFAQRKSQAGTPLKVTAATIRNWIKRGVCRKRPGPKPIEEDLALAACRLTFLALAIFLVYGKTSCRSAKGAASISRTLRERHQFFYTEAQVRRRLDRVEEIIGKLSLEDFLKLSHVLLKNRRQVNQRRLVYQIDATQLPFTAYDPETHRLSVVYVTLAIDVATRVVVGWHVSFRSPTYADTIRALLLAILPKNQWGLPGHGVPWIVQSDNGSIFGRTFLQILRRLGILAMKSDPGCPQQNAVVERFNGTLKLLMQIDFWHEIASHLPEGLGLLSDASGGVFYQDDLRRAVTATIIRYNARRHSVLKCAPIKRWHCEWEFERVRDFSRKEILGAFRVSENVKPRDGKLRLLDGSEIESSVFDKFRHGEITVTTTLSESQDTVELSCDGKVISRTNIKHPRAFIVPEQLEGPESPTPEPAHSFPPQRERPTVKPPPEEDFPEIQPGGFNRWKIVRPIS